MPNKKINDVTKITGITENALRYYNNKGLVAPTIKKRTGRKEWLYDEDAIEKLKVVRMYRQIELSVDDIKTIMNGSGDNAREVLVNHLKILKAKLRRVDLEIAATELLIKMENELHETETSHSDALSDTIEKINQLLNDEEENAL